MGPPEYASAGQGLATFAEFDFGATVSLAAFRHQEKREWRKRFAASELVCLDERGREIARVPITMSDRSRARCDFSAHLSAVVSE